jgi:hypothetical protein
MSGGRLLFGSGDQLERGPSTQPGDSPGKWHLDQIDVTIIAVVDPRDDRPTGDVENLIMRVSSMSPGSSGGSSA